MNAITQDMTKALRSTGLLANYTARKWAGEVKDEKALRGVKQQAGIAHDIDAGKVVKKVLAGSDKELKAVNKLLSAGRLKHYELTLPWSAGEGATRGPRFLPNRTFYHYTEALGAIKATYEPLVEEFVQLYPSRIAEAMTNLGNLANGNDYPNVAFIRSRFEMSFSFEPIASGSDFQGLPAETLDILGKVSEARNDERIELAMTDAFTRAKDAVSHMADKLADPKAIFRDSLVRNIEDLIGLLPAFNITGDANLDTLCQEMQELVMSDAKELREDANTRGHVAEKARKLSARIDNLM